MKILFICGCMEPGRDGVGDYTRRLSGELVKNGHSVTILAIYDPYIQGVKPEEQKGESFPIPVLRIGEGLFPEKAQSLMNKWLKYENPEWLSLQYVPFSFQKYGIPWHLGSRLAELGEGRKWHIMFHELWVGMDKESPFKHKLWGKVQAIIAKRIIEKLQPEIMHTQANLYQAQLDRIGFKVQLLPLFGNIPLCLVPKEEKKTKNTLTFVVFGQIQPGAPIEDFAAEVAQYGRMGKRKIQFIFVGRSGRELEKWISACTLENIEVLVLGEQNTREISLIFGKGDWGISTTPVLQIEKSGSVTAMLEHGLPVYCVARPWSTTKVSCPHLPEGIRVYEPGAFDMEGMNWNKANQSQLGKVSNMFITSLTSHTSVVSEPMSLRDFNISAK